MRFYRWQVGRLLLASSGDCAQWQPETTCSVVLSSQQIQFKLSQSNNIITYFVRYPDISRVASTTTHHHHQTTSIVIKLVKLQQQNSHLVIHSEEGFHHHYHHHLSTPTPTFYFPKSLFRVSFRVLKDRVLSNRM